MAAALGALDIEDIGNSIDEEIGASAGGSGGSEDEGECSAGRAADGEPAPEQSRGGGADRLPELDVTPQGDRPQSPSQVTLLTDARPLPHRRHPSPHRGCRAAPCDTCHPRPQRYGLPQLPPGAHKQRRARNPKLPDKHRRLSVLFSFTQVPSKAAVVVGLAGLLARVG